MTGYYQPKQEWLAQMRAGQFQYHDAREREVSLQVDGDTAELVGRLGSHHLVIPGIGSLR